MGYYIPNNIPIEERENVQAISEPSSLKDVADNEAIICEVDNGQFKANSFAYSDRQLEIFLEPDPRPKRWFKMSLSEAKELSGFN